MTIYICLHVDVCFCASELIYSVLVFNRSVLVFSVLLSIHSEIDISCILSLLLRHLYVHINTLK